MLGRVLTEEEERQRRQADVAAPAEADSSHAVEQQHDVGVVAADAAAPTHDEPYLGSSPGYGSVTSFGRYAAEGEEHHQADYEEYTDYDGSENDDASFESYNDASSGDEDSYLLHPNNNRRRKRKGSRRDLQNQSSSYRWMKSFKKATRKLARKIRAVAVIIADVDNVWDSPENSTTTSNNSSNRSRRANGGNNTRSSMVYDVITGGTSTIRNRTAAIFWFVVLSISYASERSTFKIMVDRVGPFRLFSAEIILGLHVLFSSLAMLFWNIFWNKDKKEFGSSYGSGFGLGLPLADVGLMAILDTVYLLVGVISGAHVPPVLTVILVQAVIPLTACFTQCVHPDGYCYGYCNPNESNEPAYEYSVNDASDYYPTDDASTAFDSRSNHTRSTHTNIRINNHSSYADVSTIPNLPQPSTMPDPVAGWGGLSKYHLIGTGLMFLAIFMGLTPALLSLDEIIITEHDAMPEKTAYNTIVFCVAAIPAAISQLYKERTMIRLKQPIDRNKLNLVLSIFQLLFAVVVSPLAYGLQGMGAGSGWTAQYPSTQISQNFSDGFYCFLGILDKDTQATGYPEDARCEYAWELVIMHVISILLVGVACDKLAAATKIMYRGVSMGIMVAVIFMFIYQIRDKWCEYGPIVSFFHLTSTAVLIVGADVYHRVSLADASFDTVYPEIGDLYEDE